MITRLIKNEKKCLVMPLNNKQNCITQGLYSWRTHRIIGIEIPIINLKPWSDRLRSIMVIPITVNRGPETASNHRFATIYSTLLTDGRGEGEIYLCSCIICIYHMTSSSPYVLYHQHPITTTTTPLKSQVFSYAFNLSALNNCLLHFLSTRSHWCQHEPLFRFL